MSERLIVFEAGERFATLADSGMATVWVVDVDGSPKVTVPARTLLPGAEHLLGAPDIAGPDASASLHP